MTTSTIQRLAWIFTIAGAIPFAVATAALLWGESHVPAIAALLTWGLSS